MSGVLEYPKLRWPLETRLERVENQDVLMISCPVGLTTQPLFLIPAVAPILACFEGSLSVDEITAKFAVHGLTSQVVRDLITLLDDHLFLATPRFFAAQKTMLEEFLNADTRPAALAGLGYAGSKELLTSQIEKILLHRAAIPLLQSEPLAGLMAPHIDYRRGSTCYGITYNYLAGSAHDLYVLIGTAHQYSRHMFHLTRKHFESPLGKLECDVPFVNKLAVLYGEKRSFDDEILHKREHSLELQLPFLRHFHANPKIVPILVGGFHEMLRGADQPPHYEQYDRFAESLASCLRDTLGEGKSFCVVAGVDMAHVGRAFGDPEGLTPAKMEQIAHRDRIYLDAIEKQDKKALFEHIAEDGDARRICGFPTMYTVIDLFDRLGISYKARTFDYRQSVDYSSDCAVTFAGMGLYL